MGDQLKTFFSASLVRRLAADLVRVHPPFRVDGFVKDACLRAARSNSLLQLLSPSTRREGRSPAATPRM
jgi:hypothetical protein